MLVEETLVSSWIDLNFSNYRLTCSKSCFLARPTGKLSFLEIGTRRSRPELTRAVNSSLSPIAVNKHRTYMWSLYLEIQCIQYSGL